jgi:hypothetical protein
MEFKDNATLLTAESKPYSIGGNEGVSHKVRVNIGGEIYSCNSTEQQVRDLKEYEGVEGEVVVKVESRREKLSITLKSFKPE